MHAKPPWLDFPWQQHELPVNGRNMAYIDEGPATAPPVLLLSGNPTWGYLYRDFVGPLTDAGYRVIAPDWVGAGYSDHPGDDRALTLPHHIADLVSLIDQLDLRRYTVVAQDWGGPQGMGAALQRIERLAALVLMNTWLFVGHVGKFHASPKPWTTWHAPLVAPFLMGRHKVLSHDGPLALSQRGMTQDEARAYHHVFDEAGSDRVVMTWPRTIPLAEPGEDGPVGRAGDRGWADIARIEERLGELADIPVQLIWAPGDNVFTIDYADRLKELLPHARGPVLFDRASHFLQDDRGPDIAPVIVDFLREVVAP